MQERLIPPGCTQLKAKKTKTIKKAILAHLLDPPNMGDKEANIFLRKHLVTDITTQNFGFGYTTVYGTPHHGVTPFAVPRLDLTTMAQIKITQQEEDRATMIIVSEKKNSEKLPTPLLASYT